MPVVPADCAGESFPRAARLLEPGDFVRALKSRAQRGQYLWVYRRADDVVAADGDALRPARPRLGMMIGKKNARTSVLRNAVKRRIREQFRLRQAVLPDMQYVVRLSTAIKPKDVPAVIAEWTGALDREVSKFATSRGTNAASNPSNVVPVQIPQTPSKQVNA